MTAEGIFRKLYGSLIVLATLILFLAIFKTSVLAAGGYCCSHKSGSCYWDSSYIGTACTYQFPQGKSKCDAACDFWGKCDSGNGTCYYTGGSGFKSYSTIDSCSAGCTYYGLCDHTAGGNCVDWPSWAGGNAYTSQSSCDSGCYFYGNCDSTTGSCVYDARGGWVKTKSACDSGCNFRGSCNHTTGYCYYNSSGGSYGNAGDCSITCCGQPGGSATCNAGWQCCSGTCSNGVCACAGLNETCLDGVTCCGYEYCNTVTKKCVLPFAYGNSTTNCHINTWRTCTSDLQCCDGYCSYGICRSHPAYTNGHSCSSGYDCQSNVCAGGKCVAHACYSAGSWCYISEDCCSGNCQNHACSATACKANGEICNPSNNECCSGTGDYCWDNVCRPVSGRCGSGPRSVLGIPIPGDLCTHDYDCCSNYCNNGRCGDVDGRYRCIYPNNPCGCSSPPDNCKRWCDFNTCTSCDSSNFIYPRPPSYTTSSSCPVASSDVNGNSTITGYYCGWKVSYGGAAVKCSCPLHYSCPRTDCSYVECVYNGGGGATNTPIPPTGTPTPTNTPTPIPPPQYWIQTKGADLRVEGGGGIGGYNHNVPDYNTQTCSGVPTFASVVGEGGTPGIIFAGSTGYSFCNGGICQDRASIKQWVVGGTVYPEDYFSNRTTGGELKTSYAYISQRAKEAGITPTRIDSLSDIITNGVYIVKTEDGETKDLNIPEEGYDFSTIGSNKNYVILVSGNLNINGEIKVPLASGSTATFIVKGDINVSSSVGVSDCQTATANVEGFYSTDGSFRLMGNNDCTGAGADKKLNWAGNIVINAGLSADGKFENNRALCACNDSCPTLYIAERPDFIINAPEIIKSKNFIWKEEAP